MNSSDKRILIGLCLLPVVILVLLFFKHHVPIKAYYDEDAKELVISPGFLYTLEGYEVKHIYPYPKEEEILIPLSEPSEPEYRFSGVCGDHFMGEEITIYYRNSLTGRSQFDTIRAERMNDWNSFTVSGSWIDVSFHVRPEES